MKQVSLLVSILVIGIIFLPSCEKIVGEGPVITEDRYNTAFNAVKVQIDGDAYFTQSGNYRLELQAQQNVLDEIETVVSNGELKIRFRHPNTRLRSHERIIMHIAAPDVSLLEMDGSGNLQVNPLLTATSIKFTVSGSGNIHVDDVTANNIDAAISGSGKIIMAGSNANQGKASISGSGLIDMSEVLLKDADTRISGSGTIKVHATETLKAHISGSGTVHYKGTPGTIESSVSGSGSVVKM